LDFLFAEVVSQSGSDERSEENPVELALSIKSNKEIKRASTGFSLCRSGFPVWKPMRNGEVG